MLLPSVFTGFSDPFFDDFFGASKPALKGSGYLRVDNMKTDIKERENDFLIDMQLPGYSKEDVEVSIKDGYLTVSANRQETKEDKDEDGKYIHKECYRGSCQRSFYVGDHVSSENVKAQFKDGMLTLTVPKVEALPAEEVKQLVEIEG